MRADAMTGYSGEIDAYTGKKDDEIEKVTATVMKLTER